MSRYPCGSGQAGAALLAVLAILLAVTASSVAFIWFMNQQQTRAGTRYRVAAALLLAEAGVHRALAILESETPEGAPGRDWRPDGHTETVASGPMPGRYRVSITSDQDGALLVTSEGCVGDTVRRLRARVYLASPALLSALYGASVVQFERAPAAAFLLPYGAGIGDRPWVHIAAGEEVWFAQSKVSLNNPALPLDLAPGPVDPPESTGWAPAPPSPEPLRVLLSSQGALTLGEAHMRVDVQQLRMAGLNLDERVRRTERLPVFPSADRVFYRDLASRNAVNVEINRAAGKFTGDGDLERKSDSLYDQAQFARVLTYLASAEDAPSLRGGIYVTGMVTVPARSRIRIEEGALVAESTVQVNPDAELQIVHSTHTRTLPGIITLGNGAVIVGPRARLRVHGLVLTSRVFDAAAGALIEVVGALLSNDPVVSFRSDAARVVIRYDPAVLGTPGLLVPPGRHVIAWVARWEEVSR